MTNCNADLPVRNICTDLDVPLVNQMIELEPGFLGSCGLQSGGENLQGAFMWTVTSINCQGAVDELAAWDDNGPFNDFISNDDRSGSGALTRIIQVPEEGDFMIRVEIQWDEGFCSSCCSTEWSPSLERAPCSQSASRGFPVYGSFSPIRTFEAIPSPIAIILELFSCTLCGNC